MPGTVVMGVIFVDIKGFPFGEYHATGTNLGSIRFVHGGVARNVAEDMARIGSPVTFVTLGDTTPMSREAMERLEAQKIDLRYSIRVPQNGVGLWLAVMDKRATWPAAPARCRIPSRWPATSRKGARRLSPGRIASAWRWIWAKNLANGS